MGIPFLQIFFHSPTHGLRLTLLMLLATAMLAFGQGYQQQGLTADKDLVLALDPRLPAAANSAVGRAKPASFDTRKAAKEHNIASRTVTEIKELYNGYYAVAGVFGEEKNALKFVQTLENKQLHPKKVWNPGSKLHYVYLDYFADGRAAIQAIASGMNGRYRDKLWLMDVRECKELKPSPQKHLQSGVSPEEPGTDLAYKQLAREHQIPTRKISGLHGLESGYYLIAGVFGEAANAKKFSAGLRARKLEASHFYNPLKKAHYVYVGHFHQGTDAITRAASKMNGRYRNTLWILEVPTPPQKPAPATADKTYGQGAIALGPRLNPYRNEGLFYPPVRKQVAKDPPSLAKLIEKADSYFEKMWYAEAAELYEMVLNKSESPSFDIIRKAGDSHYFNTNMGRAYYWYDQLFERHKDEMSADNLFKYAHALKGTGRYGRSKRLMRLYNRKLKTEESSIPGRRAEAASREVIMDNILATEEQVSLKNLAVNSKYSDFAPMFYNEGEVVYASAVDSAFFSTRRYKWNNQPYLDLYVAKINEESEDVRDAVKFSKKINTKYHEAGVTFSPDNTTMYFTRNNYGKKLKRDKHGVNNLKIYQSKKVDGEWTEAVEVPFNSDEYSTGHPALSPDGKQLYFVSDMPGTIGGTDIFVVDVLDEGGFSEPRNLGPEINTERKEMFPFINDSKLYFSSDGHVGLGGLDIFEVAFDGEEGFLEVRNLGRPINSNKDDFSYIVNETTQKGYFASNRRGGKGDDDIYSFKRLIPEEANNNAIAGVITELVTGDVVPEALVVLLDENNRKLKEVVTGADGAFVFEDLEGNTKYTLRSEKSEFSTDSQVVSTLDNERVAVDIALRRLEDRIVVEDGIRKLKTDMIFFDFDKSYIRDDAGRELDKLVAVMRQYPGMVIKIESHTDSRGPAVYNKYLSDKRAKSTRAYLIQQGIAADRIESAIGYGEERLLNECNGSVRCSSAKHQLNRRSEFIIVKM